MDINVDTLSQKTMEELLQLQHEIHKNLWGIIASHYCESSRYLNYRQQAVDGLKLFTRVRDELDKQVPESESLDFYKGISSLGNYIELLAQTFDRKNNQFFDAF